MRPLDSSMFAGGGTGVVVLGHGSRAPEALEVLNWVAERLTERLRMPVLAASLQFNKPSLEESCRELAATGASRVVVAPYFLFVGNHMQKDIPEVMDRLRQELPETEFILAEALGADDLMVEVLAQRALAKIGEEVAGETAKEPEDNSRKEGDAADFFASVLGNACDSCAPMAQHPIEVESFEIIDSLLEPEDAEDPEYHVVRRIVHTTGDPSLARAVLISAGAIRAGVDAIAARAGIYCDVNMVASGIMPTADRLGLDVICLVAEPAVEQLARNEGVTRGVAAMRLAARGGSNVNDNSSLQPGGGLEGAIVAIGNSPTALFELLRLVSEEGVKPALIVGVPVGFVGAAESKEALLESDIPYITIPGNRGGSTIAAAVVNALMRLGVSGQE
ncbi:MAG: precorrin-8X methylmutase [Thermoleophilia bacterium]|nr:precorrin-8X methylmutase [Thermoleophilia bacterium]